eukprot:TRINITY_DN11515_c0_g1_i2.p1 TRINITY_DN11515_c0_g1~~TRINITY_DN11515_c0_g1_i2.p1  ORF type:complete len:400 (+),score=118.74 TRINITY_DN11515_c0_g1_i2:67-1200(+)
MAVAATLLLLAARAAAAPPLCFPFRNESSNYASVPGNWSLAPAPGAPPVCCKRMQNYCCGQWAAPHKDTYANRLSFVPQGCHLAPFNVDSFLAKLKGRTMLFAGDSITKQMYLSLLCMLEGSGVEKGPAPDLGPAKGFMELDRGIECAYYPQHDVRVCDIHLKEAELTKCFGFGSRCHYLQQGSMAHRRCCWRNLLLNPLLNAGDLMVLNIGHHFGENKPTYVNMVKQLMEAIARKPESSCHAPSVLYRDTLPQYFTTKDGSYDPSVHTAKLQKCGITAKTHHALEHGEPGRWQWPMLRVAETALGPWPGGRTPNVGKRAGEGIVDCTHWCYGAIPELMLTMLYNYILSEVWLPDFRRCQDARSTQSAASRARQLLR